MRPAKIIGCVLFILTALMFCVDVFSATGSPPANRVIILDAGHTPKQPGAISITGRYEVEYNDRLIAKTATALQEAGFMPLLTRKPGQEIQLEERANTANSHNALLMLSIHHDSAQLVHLVPFDKNGRKAFRTKEPIAGYSLFISGKNPQFENSLAFAHLLGEELKKHGRNPSLHHAEPIPGEGRLLLDTRLGIYQYDDLVVLKKTTIPAVLLEVGVIVDQADEDYVVRPSHQKMVTEAIIDALKKYTASKRKPGA